ncbi:MAG: efflux RND transporter periplasmic adaptor subunit [Leptolyngbya sp.]|nr:efflux RND transporter periplasmic adaptor subunit [Candidatus Melainabacteria bacterium]
MYLADGSKFPHAGKVSNTLNEVDKRTGTLEVQAQFPNPEKSVLPGQFARVKYIREHLADAITIPVKAVQQTQSLTSVLVTNSKNEVESRVVKLGQRVGEKFIVLSGLKTGENIIVEGQMAVRPGMKVNPVVKSEAQTASQPTQVR